jgi:biopolymer transport protein ExbD
MKSPIAILTILELLLLILFAGCSNSPNSKPDELKALTNDSPYVKVFVSKSGEITLDGKGASLDEVGTAFAALVQKKGVVLYARESPEQYEPHPNAMRVIELVTRNSLPIRLCRVKDCSDELDANGKLKK